MKTLLISFLCISSMAFSQKMESIEIQGKTIEVGQEITLGKGSGQDGKFLYCFLSGGMAAFPMGPGFEGATFTVKKIQMMKHMGLNRPSILMKSDGARVRCDIEKAVENKEVIL